MSDADLRLVCTQEDIDCTGAMVEVQVRLHVHLFDPLRTPTEAVRAMCDVEFASALLQRATTMPLSTAPQVASERTSLFAREAGDG